MVRELKEMKCKEEVKREIAMLAISQETGWKQNLKALWLNERNGNTKFFHMVVVTNGRGIL